MRESLPPEQPSKLKVFLLTVAIFVFIALVIYLGWNILANLVG